MKKKEFLEKNEISRKRKKNCTDKKNPALPRTIKLQT